MNTNQITRKRIHLALISPLNGIERVEFDADGADVDASGAVHIYFIKSGTFINGADEEDYYRHKQHIVTYSPHRWTEYRFSQD